MKTEAMKTCFVIMPFTVKEIDRPKYKDADHWNEVYEGLIMPAVQEIGFACIRDDKDIGTRLIAEGVLEKLEKADIILCDLSSHNANVFLELGWALRADKPFVLIKDELTEHTFDLNQQYTFEYLHSLRPVHLKAKIKELAAVIRQTLLDRERRYSLVRRIAISFSTIKAVNEGDLQAQILSDLQQRVAEIQKAIGFGRAQAPAESFPWPELLRRGTALLAEAKRRLDGMGKSLPPDEIVSIMTEVATNAGALHSRDIQISLSDDGERLLFHDWPGMIGGNAVFLAQEDQNLLDDDKYPFGAVAWTDTGSNIPIGSSMNRRRNIGLFASLKGRPKWRLFVELHQEIG